MRKFLTSILAIILISVAMMNSVYAEQLQTTIDITPNMTEVNVGDKVVFTFVLKDIANAKDNSIGAIEGKVTYDTDFFELVTGTTNTTFTTGGESGEAFNILCNDAKEGESIAILTLKVKDTATGSGVVKFTGLLASDGDVDRADEAIAQTADKEITIKLKSQEGIKQDNNQKPSTSDENSVQNNVITPVTNNDTTVANINIPKAGISVILVIAVVLAIILAIVIYIKNKKFKDIN